MKTSGWTAFAATMLIVAGIFSALNGLVALIHDEVYLVGEDQVVALDFTQWGWIHLIGGLIVILTGIAVVSGATWARVVGVVVAVVHAMGQIAFIEAYPFWTLTIIAIDVIVIYGLLVHGEEIEGV
jgi:hypothetical protein